MTSFDICVQGQGIVGRALALSLAAQGWRVAVVSGPSPAVARQAPDVRAYALNQGSVELLRQLKAWPALQATAATRVVRMEVFGDREGHLEFSAWQQGVTDLAWIVDAPAIERVLGEAMRYAANIEVVAAPPPASLLAVCEGTQSSTRERLGVSYERHPYGHSAVAARVVADLPHRGVAWQWFRSPDILALLPFDDPQPQASYALVWSLPQARAHELMGLDDEAFVATLNRALAGQAPGHPMSGQALPEPAPAGPAGRILGASARASWPLALSRATAWSGPGWVLAGDAAHQVHPLSGQGLNLGLGDVRALSRVLQAVREREPWLSPGDPAVGRRYERERWLATRAMAGLTDGMLHLFASSSPVMAGLRNQGMRWVDRLGALKRRMVDHALDPST